MYTNPSRQVTFEDFEQPLGMSLTKDNQWVKQASLIPWDKLEALYAKCFPSRTGTAAKSVRLMFGAVLIQQRYDLSDREVVGMIQENPYLQYFCGLSGYDSSKPPFDPSSLVHFRKRLGENHLMEQYGELVVASCRSAIKSRKKDKNSGTPPDRPSGGNAAADPPASSSESETAAPVKAVEAGGTAETANPASSKNAGTLILDATCAPQNIRFPQDTSLLNEAREKADNLIDELFSQVRQPGEKRPRTYRETAAKEHQGFSMKRRHTAKDIRRHVGHQLKQLKRNLKCVDDLLARGAKLPEKAAALLEVLKLVHDQQEEMYRTRTHRVADRIVSIAQPWIRPIVRGKTKTPTEFGPKVHLSISDGFVRVEQCEYAAFNESICLQECGAIP